MPKIEQDVVLLHSGVSQNNHFNDQMAVFPGQGSCATIRFILIWCLHEISSTKKKSKLAEIVQARAVKILTAFLDKYMPFPTLKDLRECDLIAPSLLLSILPHFHYVSF